MAVVSMHGGGGDDGGYDGDNWLHWCDFRPTGKSWETLVQTPLNLFMMNNERTFTVHLLQNNMINVTCMFLAVLHVFFLPFPAFCFNPTNPPHPHLVVSHQNDKPTMSTSLVGHIPPQKMNACRLEKGPHVPNGNSILNHHFSGGSLVLGGVFGVNDDA